MSSESFCSCIAAKVVYHLMASARSARSLLHSREQKKSRSVGLRSDELISSGSLCLLRSKVLHLHASLRVDVGPSHKTLGDGYLGSKLDEGRSKVR